MPLSNKCFLLKYFSLLLFLTTGRLGFAQKTIISGKITDAVTQKPLPFAQVGFPYTSIAVFSDEKGNYTIQTSKSSDSLTASFLGYKNTSKPIKKGIAQKINFALIPNIIARPSIVLYKDGPAVRLLKKVLKNKPKNQKENLESYSYEVYTKIKIGAIDYKKLQKKFFLPKAFRFFFTNIDSSAAKPYLPLFITESVKKYTYQKNPKKEKTEVVSTKMSGFKNQSLSIIFEDRIPSLYVYDNYFSLFSKNFISPVSDKALNYYNYKIADTLWFENSYCYKLQFEPKHKQQLTFLGTVYIEDSSFAVKRIEAKMDEDANLNFITGLSFEQDYKTIGHTSLLSKEHYFVNGLIVLPGLGKRHFYGEKASSYEKIKLNGKNDFDNTYSNAEQDKETKGKAAVSWDTLRHFPLTQSEEKLYLYTDSLKNLPLFKNMLFLFTGYKNIKGFQVGPYFSLYSFNPVEGSRFKIGIRSTPEISAHWLLQTHLAYGTRDKRFKYGLNLQYFFSKAPRNYVEFFLKDDITQLTWMQNSYRSKDNFTGTLFKISAANQLIRQQEFKLLYSKEWKKGLINTLQIRRNSIFPLQELVFYHPTGTGKEKRNSLTTGELCLMMHYGIKASYLVGDYKRISLGTEYPVFDLLVSKGIKNLLGGDYNFTKAVFSIRQKLKTGTLGRLKYRMETGKIWGSVPYPLLELHNGNQTVLYDELSFNTMNFFEFASDQYLSIAATQFFNGLIFNRIPLIRKLKLREVASGKLLWGSLRSEHTGVLEMPPNLYAFNKTPFAEAGVGIDNIFRILRVDFLWRFSYLNHSNIDRFKIMGSIHLSF